MKILNGAAVLAAWSALAAGGAAHAQEAVFLTLPLGDLANTQLESPPLSGYSAPLEAVDPLILNGIPFVHTPGAWAWNSHVAAKAGHPTSITLEVGGLRADIIYTQINTYWGSSDGVSGVIDVQFVDGSATQLDLVGNYNIRDYVDGTYTNELTAPNAIPAFEWMSHRMDIQTWVLADFKDAGIASLTLTDHGAAGVSRVILGGVTLAFSADCNGDGIVDYGQILDGTLEDTNGNGVPDCCDEGVSCAVDEPAVQWRVEDGGNGHWYQVHSLPDSGPSGVCWSYAHNDALARGGDLVSLTSPAENDFVAGALSTFPDCGCYTYLGWIGIETDSHWSSGEPITWTNWGGTAPSGDGPHATMGFPEIGGSWNDIGGPDGCHVSNCCPLNRWIVEYSADCNGDGIVDYGQILDGTLEDTNGNGVPDCCDEGVSCDPCLGDVNFDGIVNGADISAVLGFWGQAGKPLPAADITQDGIVNGADLAVLLGSWGPCQ